MGVVARVQSIQSVLAGGIRRRYPRICEKSATRGRFRPPFCLLNLKPGSVIPSSPLSPMTASMEMYEYDSHARPRGLHLRALLLLVQTPAALAQASPRHGEAIENRKGLEVVFTKWLTDWPNMAGLVSGDAGGGLYAGEILAYDHTEALDRIEALYHVRGAGRRFTARVTVVQNNRKGTARITGVVISGAFTGKRVRGDTRSSGHARYRHPNRRPS